MINENGEIEADESDKRFSKRQRLPSKNPLVPEQGIVAGSASRRSAQGKAMGRLRSGSFAGTYAKRSLAIAISAGIAFCAEPSTKARIVPVNSQDVIPISVSIGYSTLVVLPEGEEIMAASNGNTKIWAVDWKRNLAFVKMGIDTPGSRTNVNIVTASGNVYSLMATEVSQSKTESVDLKVILQQEDTHSLANMQNPAFVRSDLVAELQEGLKKKEDELEQVKKNAVLDAVRDQVHDYEWKQGKESAAFGLRAIYHDKLFTYVELDTQTAPAIYEQIDGKDSIVQYSLKDGKYVITHVMDDGTFRAGKTKLEFKRKKG